MSWKETENFIEDMKAEMDSNSERINKAIAKFKELHCEPVKCIKCNTTEGVKEVVIWSDPYCDPCLDKALIDDQDDLFDSIDDSEWPNY